MPTHDYIIANGTGAAVRADINLALSAIVSLNSSASEPGTMYAYQLWADTAAGLLKIRNSANTAWITLRQLDGDFSIVAVEDGLQATPSLTFTNDLNTGVFRSGADALGIVTGGQYAIACTSTQAVGIKTANPSTALHVAGNARVGADDVTDAHLQIGKGASGNRNSYIDIVADTTYTDYGLRVIRNNTGANATSELKHRGTGALNITTQEAAPIEFYTANSPRVAIDSSGRLLVGTSIARTIFENGAASARVQVEGTDNSTSRLTVIRNGGGGGITLAGTAGASVASIDAVANNATVGEIAFAGSDGTDFVNAANISAYVDGTVGANAMPGRLVFSTTADGAASPTERMSIKQDGRIWIGNTADLISNTTVLSVEGTRGIDAKSTGGAANQVVTFWNNATTGDNLFASLRTETSDTVRGTIDYNRAAGLVRYNTTSDRRLKSAIQPATSAVDLLSSIQVRSYKWTETDYTVNYGFIAQELNVVLPDAVKQGDDGDEVVDAWAVDNSKVVPLLTKALQEAIAKIESLEARLTAAGI